MSVKDRIQSLEYKHELLDQKIGKEQKSPLPDVTILRELKIRKLRLKEELFKLLAE